MPKTILLASQSPRRKQLLEQIGFMPICLPVDVDESILEGESATDYCQRLALEKALTGWQKSEKLIPALGSDTIVVYNDEILGKPRDVEHALNMLMKLSGQKHQVMTAVAIVTNNKQKVVMQVSEVEFDKLNEQQVKAYIKTKEPMDKAGSYGIQGYAGQWIKHISGSHSGIMGLPLYETARLIKQCYE